MNKYLKFLMLSITLFYLVGCNKTNAEVPAFNVLHELEINIGEDFDLFSGVSASSNLSNKISVSISNLNDFNPNKEGVYEIEYQAVDEFGNYTKEIRIIKVNGTNSPNSDIIFLNAQDGFLPDLHSLIDVDINLFSNIELSNSVSINELTITNLDELNINKIGLYILNYSILSSDNITHNIKRKVFIHENNVAIYDALLVNDNTIEYVFNNENAFNYTSSGTQFRSFDQIQIMEKSFFLDLFNSKKEDHTNNGNIPFFTSGVIVLLDQDFQFIYMRVAPSTI